MLKILSVTKIIATNNFNLKTLCHEVENDKALKVSILH